MHFLIGADIVTFTSRLIFLKAGQCSSRSDLHEGINAVRNHCLDALLPPHTGCHLLDQKAARQCSITHILAGYIRHIRNLQLHKADALERFGQPLGRSFHHRGMERAAYIQRKYPLCACFFNFSEASATAASYPVMTI